MGTVVDVDGTVQRGTTAALRRGGIDADDIDSVLTASADRLGYLMEEVTARRRPWQGHRALRTAAVRDSLAALSLPTLTPELEAEVAAITDHLAPWPDAVDGVNRMQRSVVTMALSNADTAELAAMSAAAGLSWHVALSAELVKAFKPDAAVYLLALRLLDVSPEQAMMVAAHPWDLRAAAEHGIATAFINRPGAEPLTADDDFDLTADDLNHLAVQLEDQRLHPPR